MKVRRRIVLTVLTLGVLCGGVAAATLSLLNLSLSQEAARDGPGTWYTLPPMPTARQEISSAYYAGYVVTIGGYNTARASTNTVEAYDPRTNSWFTGPPIPIITNHNAAAVATGRLYTFGGTSNRVFVYDPEQGGWVDVAPMRYMHGNTPAVAVINDRIYVAGGTGPGMSGSETEVYDPVQNVWTTLAPMSVPRNHCAGGAIGGKFYVVGGRPGVAAGRALEVYDPQTNLWRTLTPMPTGRSGIAAGVLNGKLYVFGGETPGVFSEVEAYDPASGIWESLAPMPTPRHGIFAIVAEEYNAIALAGGATREGFGATNVFEAFVPE